ncbi:MAG TPA: hypothetical protein VFN43_12030, partial [Humibacillus sp.]|nr:hypothetical protein [Humibacillus sp.]
ARFLLLEPPLPLYARAGYSTLASGGVSLLPGWARSMLGIPLPAAASTLVARPLGAPPHRGRALGHGRALRAAPLRQPPGARRKLRPGHPAYGRGLPGCQPHGIQCGKRHSEIEDDHAEQHLHADHTRRHRGVRQPLAP